MTPATPENERRVLQAVRDCRHRGEVLAPGGTVCGERLRCRAGKGDPPGVVCLATCVACKCLELWPGDQMTRKDKPCSIT